MPSPDADPWCIDFVFMVAASLVLAIEHGLVKVRVFYDKSSYD